MEKPKQYTPEEIAEMEKSRTISDAELLKGGAEYVVDEKGEKELRVTENQSREAHEDFEKNQKSENDAFNEGVVRQELERVFEKAKLAFFGKGEIQYSEDQERYLSAERALEEHDEKIKRKKWAAERPAKHALLIKEMTQKFTKLKEKIANWDGIDVDRVKDEEVRRILQLATRKEVELLVEKNEIWKDNYDWNTVSQKLTQILVHLTYVQLFIMVFS